MVGHYALEEKKSTILHIWQNAQNLRQIPHGVFVFSYLLVMMAVRFSLDTQMVSADVRMSTCIGGMLLEESQLLSYVKRVISLCDVLISVSQPPHPNGTACCADDHVKSTIGDLKPVSLEEPAGCVTSVQPKDLSSALLREIWHFPTREWLEGP